MREGFTSWWQIAFNCTVLTSMCKVWCTDLLVQDLPSLPAAGICGLMRCRDYALHGNQDFLQNWLVHPTQSPLGALMDQIKAGKLPKTRGRLPRTLYSILTHTTLQDHAGLHSVLASGMYLEKVHHSRAPRHCAALALSPFL